MEAPETASRVAEQTEGEVNRKILKNIEENIAFYSSCDRSGIDRRLRELDREWDTERVLETTASSFALLGLALGATVNRKWFLFPAVVTGFLLQHAIQGWCPPLAVIRRLGVRTAREIDYERYALKAARGDFGGIGGGGAQRVDPGKVLQAVI